MTINERIIYKVYALYHSTRFNRDHSGYCITINNDNINLNKLLFEELGHSDTLYYSIRHNYALLTSKPVDEEYIKITFDDKGVSTVDKSIIQKLRVDLKVRDEECTFLNVDTIYHEDTDVVIIYAF